MITKVAIKFEGKVFALERPNRHHNVLRMIYELYGRRGDSGGPGAQGFVDEKGNFLTRQEAWKVAEANNQIVNRCGGDTSNGGTLYSENLW